MSLSLAGREGQDFHEEKRDGERFPSPVAGTLRIAGSGVDGLGVFLGKVNTAQEGGMGSREKKRSSIRSEGGRGGASRGQERSKGR